MKITADSLIKKVENRSFKTESEMSKYFESIAPSIFGINEKRIVSELRTTAHDATLSNLTDMVIFDNKDRDQVLVVFEFKLDKSIRQHSKNSYGAAERQLHKYAQDLKAPYGVLLSEKVCRIFKYTYRGSMFRFDEKFFLPELIEIEKGLYKNESENKKENDKTIVESKEKSYLPMVLGAFFVFALFLIIALFPSENDNGNDAKYLNVEEVLEVEENVDLHRPEYVDVHGREDKLDIAHNRWEVIDTTKSSFIRGSWYDKENSYLIMDLDGRNYQYCGVNEEIWFAYKNAESFGIYFNENIKGNYQCHLDKSKIPVY